jgi:hypothetical protein
MRKNSVLRLKRYNTLWRMDSETFSRFMSYVCVYFKIGDQSNEFEYKDIQYADISFENLKVACAIFGRYFPNSNSLQLAPVKSGNFVKHHGLTFKLEICEKKEEKLIYRSVILNAA